MNNYSVDEDYRNMLSSFGTNDLQTLLGAFGQNKRARKSELKNRAIELLRTRPDYINYEAYIGKIYEIYFSLQHREPCRDIIIRSLLQNQQQQQRQIISYMGHIQNPPHRMYPPPQFSRQSMHMAQAGLCQVVPKMQRGTYGNHISNSVPANNVINNNIQYIDAGNFQPSGTCTIVSRQLPPIQQMSVVAQDALRLGTTATRNNSCIPSIESVSQIEFKKIPFYEVIDEVIKPTLLTGTDRCTLQDVPRGMKEATFKFNLSLEHANLIATNRDTSHGKNEYLYQFQIRICQLIEPVPDDSPDYMPLGLHLRVNVKSCPLPPTAPYTRPGSESRRTARPINCTENIKLSPIVANNITINWTPDGKYYVFAVYIVKKITVDTLIKKLQDKGGRSAEETKNYIIKKLTDINQDLATISYRVSLVCPFGKIRMKVPAKSIHCDHLQCFDARTFILMNEKALTWMCPTCNKPCLYDDIQIENYFLEVVSSTTLNNLNKEIELLSDGTWRAFEETKNTNCSRDNVKPIDYVDLNSDDEEPPTEADKQENENQAANAIRPVAVVDLKSSTAITSLYQF
ncbi:hypothetical protein AGLY_017546 [Aphis glycines]|uniref:SP-RING-type domain-containing protein n=1 Tax=Aphis glycines TaxID=307491 RepID=A0A6G0SUJ4_APHGL|nr:hypothetical protein AGLY_017546 [Aphis glycines]